MSRGGCYINLNHSFPDSRDSLFLFRSISSRKETRTSPGYLFYANVRNRNRSTIESFFANFSSIEIQYRVKYYGFRSVISIKSRDNFSPPGGEIDLKNCRLIDPPKLAGMEIPKLYALIQKPNLSFYDR